MIAMPSAAARSASARGTGRAAQADAADPRRVLGREVGMVEDAREEHRRARARADVGFEHDFEHTRRVPAVDQVDVLPDLDRREHRAEHARRVRDRRTHQVGRCRGEIHARMCKSSASRVRWLCITPFGSLVVPDVYASTHTSSGSAAATASAGAAAS